jgi:hypothetical protein
MTIDECRTANNVHREIIDKLKRFINDCDHTIQMNEIEIGRQLEAMQHNSDAYKLEDCTLCLGECEQGEQNGNV